MREQVGERYQGVISAVTSFGAFVEIDEPFVEGLIRIDSLAGEPFTYDEVHLRLTGQLTGTVLALGDTVTVEIANVSVLRRRIDLALIATKAGEVRKLPPQAMAGHKRPRHGQSDGADGQLPWSNAKVGVAGARRAGRAVGKAVQDSRGGKGGAGPLRLGVSHRSRVTDEEELLARSRDRRGKGGGGKHKHKAGGKGAGPKHAAGKPPAGKGGKPAAKPSKQGKRKRR
jgi:predicted RNA-binding protein with RPS1 domain